MILQIETSTQVCSVALSHKGQLLFEKVSYEGPSHAALAGSFVEEALQEMKRQQGRLEAVAVSSGPGSYTGLRIGVSLAKGLCFGYDVPLIAIPTLDILAYTAIHSHATDSGALYCAMLDARRMEVYSALYDAKLTPVETVKAEIITAESYMDYLEKTEVCFFGNGATKCQKIITSPKAVFLDGMDPLALHMIPLAEKAFAEKRFVDVAYFEPFYLKEFQATIARNKVLGDLKK
ncbi:tRNA threonylcarbamoyladenosine biosynthesis protein TsaB [Parabacteroides sp. PFB2-10]|uniref:tRNA (adenosine(37)-N6)-threonylcarbamoyltransferase complex dimerization subunit type 1 TsaB n=1 Tax=Parabacteroides sp. PFB2-10 TaxID=1742405 RepID=UPI00247582BB|nr:tRNA (adenosine(37)-N6)-threonylcarbamoyltransferase complex dimerization subunit type 1 TsaB [Parabacteroides sp. PFB2-10]MDH6313551.1 tRNA threonylcarbamoyladenosine biosynthesis protein TsaB [Parabacteroides sp. PFB2-10]